MSPNESPISITLIKDHVHVPRPFFFYLNRMMPDKRLYVTSTHQNQINNDEYPSEFQFWSQPSGHPSAQNLQLKTLANDKMNIYVDGLRLIAIFMFRYATGPGLHLLNIVQIAKC